MATIVGNARTRSGSNFDTRSWALQRFLIDMCPGCGFRRDGVPGLKADRCSFQIENGVL